MPENIAGEIPYLESLLTLIKEKKPLALSCLENILAGLGEILPLNQIFNFEIYEILEYLITDNQQNKSPQSAVVLLSALAKFDTLTNNDEYTFDEDKSTKQELQEIFKLLKNQQEYFWNAQKKLAIKEIFASSNIRIENAMNVIAEFKIVEAKESLLELLQSQNEIVICEAVATLKQLDYIKELNKQDILSKLNDENKKAIIENLFIGV